MDYEAEYNNRARVPEHPEIFARWQREAADYRAKADAEEGCALGMSYGPSPRQTLDLFFPEASGKNPLAMFVHGGYWRSLDPSTFSHMARGLNTRGIAVAVAGYDLCPQVTINEIIGQIRNACLYLWRRFGQRVMIYGHSAGGHLAACMLATDWKKLASDVPADLVPAGYSISGVFDLTPLVQVSMNHELKLDEAEAHRVSPLEWPIVRTCVLDAVVGGLESPEFLRQSKAITQTWGARGAETRYEEIPGTNHFTVADALTDPESAMVKRLAALCKRTQGA
jgi:arylformamidase